MPTIYDILDELEIPYTEYKHPPVYTVEEAERLARNVPGEIAKNLFLTNKEENKFYLVSVLPQKRIDLKQLQELLKESKLHFASPGQLYQYLRQLPGAVSPLGLMHDSKKEVVYLIDKDILTRSGVCVHPNVNTATLAIQKKGFKRLLKWWGNTVIEIDIK